MRGTRFKERRNSYSRSRHVDSDEETQRPDYTGQNIDENKVEQYPCRILIPTDMIKVVLGKSGSTINGIQERTQTKIDIHREKGSNQSRRQPEDTLATIKGTNENFSGAVKEIMKVIDSEFKKYEEHRPLQLKLLAHDNLCGRIIGKAGNNLKEISKATGARLVISNSLFDDISAYNHAGTSAHCHGERVVTIEGSLDGILSAEESVSFKLRHFLQRDLKNSSQSVNPTMGGYQMPPFPFNQMYGNYNYYYPPGYFGAQGYPGQIPGILGGRYPPVTQLSNRPNPHHSDKIEKVYVMIATKEVGAMIGRKGSHIAYMKECSKAQIKVIKGDECGDSKVEICGTPSSQWMAQLMVFSKVKESIKLPYSEAQLKTEYYIPGSCVGRIIGKKGQVVQEIQEKSMTDIEIPKDQQNGSECPVFITGTFNSTQICLNRIRDIVSRAIEKEGL